MQFHLPAKLIIRVHTILFIFTPFIIIGCISPTLTVPPNTSGTHASTYENSPIRNDSVLIEPDSVLHNRITLLEEQAYLWQGTPHELGGTTMAGIDCSALVQTIFTDAFDTFLPRSTAEQVNEGRRISVSNLEPGDLVFYRINSRTRHVGIYIKDNTFLHASKSEGVAVTSLDSPYWRKRFWMARRVLPPIHQNNNTSEGQDNFRVKW